MSYFNHAFQKTMFAGKGVGFTPATTYASSLAFGQGAGVGAVAFADQALAGWPTTTVASAPVVAGAPLTLIATSLYQNDKVGPFHGGYQETTKSKMINPRYITKFYKVEAKAAVSHIIGVGATPNLDLAAADAECCPQFYCDETYSVRLDLKGSPVLRMLNHNEYEVVNFNTGCCTGATPELVDPALVMQGWTKYIANDPILSGVSYAPGFAQQTSNRLVNVGFTNTCDDGTTWDLYLPDNAQAGIAGVYFEADGTTLTAEGQSFADNVEAASVITWNSVVPSSTFVSTFDPLNPICCAGIVLESAFVETKFGDCTFQTTDKFEIEPLLIQASMVDETGDPCVFDQLCISDGITPSGANSQAVYPAIQFGKQTMGTGESVLRDLILSERYQQNPLGSGDLRIREITQGYDVLDAVDRNALYDCYYIQHSIPRHNNATSTFDNDQYLLAIPMLANAAGGASLETFMAAWLTGANSIVTLETY